MHPSPELTTAYDTAAALVDRLKAQWRDDRALPDAEQALCQHPQILEHQSLVIDLAYEEYCLRESAGSRPDVDAFCRRFVRYESQIRDVLQGHLALADHPNLFAAREVQWPAVGDPFEGMRLTQELGRGAFARVYLCHDPDTGDRPVVLKLSPSFSAEARIVGPITHPNIVSVHWAKRVGAFYAVCMPYVGGRTLHDVIQDSYPPTSVSPESAQSFLSPQGRDLDRMIGSKQAAPFLTGREPFQTGVIAVAYAIADALCHLHSHGITHGDLKPSNVLISNDGRPLLIDFNLATHEVEHLTQTGGTLPYMAPERLQLLFGPSDTTSAVAADIYAFGVLLYELLTGKLPYTPVKGLTPRAEAAYLLELHQTVTIPPSTLSNVPVPLATLILKCLSSNPADRPSSIDTIRSQIEWFLNRQRHLRAWKQLALAIAGLVLFNVTVFHIGRWFESSETKLSASQAVAVPQESELLSRARAALRANNVRAAIVDLGQLNQTTPSGESTSLLAYCHTLQREHRLAEVMYKISMTRYQYAPAWVANNRAYHLLQIGGSNQYLTQAHADATVAITQAPTASPPRWNRAIAQFHLKLDKSTLILSDPECLNDMEVALAGKPPPGSLSYMASLIAAASSNGREELRLRAVAYTAAAIRAGRKSDSVMTDPVLSITLGSRKDFQDLGSLQAGLADVELQNPRVMQPD